MVAQPCALDKHLSMHGNNIPYFVLTTKKESKDNTWYFHLGWKYQALQTLST